MKPLWPHQQRTIEATRSLLASGKRSPLVVLPTGAGKTRTACEMIQGASMRGVRVLWIVHRIELVIQAADAIRACGVPCGIISPQHCRTYEPTQVASIQTLIAREQRPEAGLLIADEAHHLVADTYLAVREHYHAAWTIGLTATPCRADGVGLGNAFDSIVGCVQPRELIAGGYLVPCRVIGPPAEVRNAADFSVDAYRAHCGDRQALVFCSSVKAADDEARAFTVAGIPARNVDGGMKPDARAAVIDAFRLGRLRVLTNMHVLTEGFDVPGVGAVILSRKMGSEAAYIQAAGRAMRSAPGKVDCVLVDLMGSSHGLGILPDSDRKYSLDGKGVSAVRGELLQITQCRACGAVFQCHVFKGGVCPSCGWVRPSKPDPRVVRQEMVELQFSKLAAPTNQAKVAWLQEQLAKRRGRTGGILIMFNRVFHHFPNHAMREASGFNACLAHERAEREKKGAA